VPTETAGATPEAEPLGAPGLAALKSEREAKAAAERRAADAEARLKAIEDKDKSEAERQAEALAAARAELAELTVAKTRAEVAAAKGVPVALLSGSTLEDIEAAADALIAFRGEQSPTDRATLVIPDEGGHPKLALNGDGIESALKKALGIS